MEVVKPRTDSRIQESAREEVRSMVSQVSDEVAARIRARAAAQQKAQAAQAPRKPPPRAQHIEQGQLHMRPPAAPPSRPGGTGGPAIFRSPADAAPAGTPSPSGPPSPRSAAVIIQKTNSAGSSAEPEEAGAAPPGDAAPSDPEAGAVLPADGDVIEAASLLRSFNTHRWPTPKKSPGPGGKPQAPPARLNPPGHAAGSRGGKNTLDMLFNVTTRLGDLSECSEEKFNRLRERAAKMASSAHHELPRGITQRPSQKWVSPVSEND